MLTAAQIVTFDDSPPPPGCSPWVDGVERTRRIEIVDPDAAWPEVFEGLRARIVGALGDRALSVEHVGSTSVPGLAAKPVIDIDLTVLDTADEDSYVPALEALGFELRVREPWWLGHRCLVAAEPASNLHVWLPDSPEAARHRLFRDWLRTDGTDRERYAAAKRSVVADGLMSAYNSRKEAVIREIYARAFAAAGLLP